MYAHLTKREKKKKLALARKRDLLWSTTELTKKALRKTSSSKELTPPPTETPLLPTFHESSVDPESTIQALEQTLSDLTEQRHNLDSTIAVLQLRLESLLLQQQDIKPASK